MAAPTANNNATKWTEERTLKYLHLIEETALRGEAITLGSALVPLRLYQGVWSYWKKRWAQHEEIMDKIYFIEQMFINILVEGGLTKRLHSGQCLFILRENYRYSETVNEAVVMHDTQPEAEQMSKKALPAEQPQEATPIKSREPEAKRSEPAAITAMHTCRQLAVRPDGYSLAAIQEEVLRRHVAA